MADRAFLEHLTRKLIDDGKLVEAGFTSLRLATGLLNVSPTELDERRTTFFAGAQHVFSSIMTMLEPGAEPTENDLRRLSLLDDELKRFIAEFELRHAITKGRG